MRHSYFGKKLSRTKNERKQVIRSLVRSLMLHGSITTTLAKAKAIQSLAEQLITKAKEGTDQRTREIYADMPHKDAVRNLLDSAKTRFGKRSSGFTRIIKLGVRRGDNAESVMLSFVDPSVQVEVITPPKKADSGEGKAVVAPVKKETVKPAKKAMKKPVAKTLKK